ncbi:hypothetical protein ES703_09512 [subsurface metagenome]
MTDYLKIVYMTLITITFFVLLVWFFTDISSPHGQGFPRIIGLGVLAIDVMALAWLCEKGRELI